MPVEIAGEPLGVIPLSTLRKCQIARIVTYGGSARWVGCIVHRAHDHLFALGSNDMITDLFDG